MRSSKLALVCAIIIIGVLVLFRVVNSSSNEIAAYRFTIDKQSSLDKVLPRLEENLKRDPNSFIALNDLAGHYLSRARRLGREEDYETAEDFARRSLKILAQPNVPAQIVLAKVLSAHHDFVGAIAILEKALAEAPGAALQLFPELFTCYLGLGDLDKASAVADQLAHARPGTQTLGLRALVEEAQGRDDESYFDFVRSLKLEDLGDVENSAWVRSLFARFLIRRNQFKLAENLLKESLHILPDQPLAVGLEGDLALAQGDTAEAAEYYNRAFRIAKDAHFLLRLAETKALLGDAASATVLFQQVKSIVETDLNNKKLGHRPDLINAILGLFKLGAVPEGELQTALKLANEEVTARPTAASYFTAANTYLALKQFPEALTANLSLLRTSVRNPEYYNQTAVIYSKMNNPDREKFYLELAKKTGEVSW